jgi:alanine racemase
MLYGAYPSHQTSESISLKQVMKLKSGVSLIKWINEGESVSYGRRFIAQRRTKIATVPIGYADGYSRLLSGKSECLIGGKKYPIVGTICMDQLMVDVGVDDVLKGDEVVLWGTQNGKQIHAWEIADILSTIPYEVYCNVSSRVPRIYIKK